jgi:hypothetical protein
LVALSYAPPAQARAAGELAGVTDVHLPFCQAQVSPRYVLAFVAS